MLVEGLSYALPQPMRGLAFIDRVHGLIPSWEPPKIPQAKYHLSKGYGIASDYFAEVLHSMRKESPRRLGIPARRALQEL